MNLLDYQAETMNILADDDTIKGKAAGIELYKKGREAINILENKEKENSNDIKKFDDQTLKEIIADINNSNRETMGEIDTEKETKSIYTDKYNDEIDDGTDID